MEAVLLNIQVVCRTRRLANMCCGVTGRVAHCGARLGIARRLRRVLQQLGVWPSDVGNRSSVRPLGTEFVPLSGGECMAYVDALHTLLPCRPRGG